MTTAPVLDPMAEAAARRALEDTHNPDVRGSQEAIVRVVVTAYLAALPAPVGREPGERQEPVAWRAMCEATGGELICPAHPQLKSHMLEKADDLYGKGSYEVEPLYSQATIEALERALAERTRLYEAAVINRNYYADERQKERARATAAEALVTTLQSRVAELEVDAKRHEEAAVDIEPYLTFTIGPESVGYHPTMPSAVAAFLYAFGMHTEEGKFRVTMRYRGKSEERINELWAERKPARTLLSDKPNV